MLLVPVLNVADTTLGYAFLKGVTGASMPTAAGDTPDAPPHFIAGRFSFDARRRDFLMVVNSMSPHVTGLMSIRMRDDHRARDRCFFAIPKADYGPGNLPGRALSVQCQVDYLVDGDDSDIPATPPYEYDPNAEYGDQDRPPAEDEICSGMTWDNHETPNHIADPPDVERDFAHQADYDDDDDPTSDVLLDQVVPGMPNISADLFLPQHQAEPLPESWADGLDAMGAVISPFEDPNGVIPELLNDFVVKGGAFPDDDDVNPIFSDDEDILSGINSIMPESPDPAHEYRKQNPTTGHKRRPDVLDQLALSSPVNSSSTTSNGTDFSFHTALPASELSWILSSAGSTPDGVGVPRVPGANDTSSGSFNMNSLVDSLATIEKSLKGSFYGPKVRKDVLHPLTGELVSRCTGKVRASIDNVDASSLFHLRKIAAQTYYSSVLSVAPDARLLPLSLASRPFISAPTTSTNLRQPTDEPRRKQGRTEPQHRPAPAPLAPRPVVTISLPPGLPHPEVLQLPEPIASTTIPPAPTDEKSAREAKLEAKRIKNRLSAARSNQKRRAQLEAQKQELAELRERVQELKWRETKVSEENEILKRQILSET
ncbi:unnamed protein product [Chondrus crispus]|uniref:BZIP domain-containing protein n=1 Tax=Chondrus crispus TaxID=2769 RepID=R7Q702_CHOCR|nr:unnamed protein product [Chondrus crispus]CDF34312.1 unnamed protein product [Chondrus crispus]|eukprot:XP_005714131.1 unnamed protein product [Chondrus crispus]